MKKVDPSLRQKIQPSRRRTPRLVATEGLPNPTEYVLALQGEFRDWALDEVRAQSAKGKWREVFGVSPEAPMDLEIGTGNGYFFAHQAGIAKERSLLGLEIKFKPLIQSIRRARRAGLTNARICRYDASCLEDLFASNELDNVFIHHPDPWPRQRDHKHRLIQTEFLDNLWTLMKPGSEVSFKTDSEDYFDWTLPLVNQSKFNLLYSTRDLHHSDWANQNFVTHFEQIFLAKGQPIFYCRFQKN